MRQGQQNKRMRGRSRKGPNPLTRSFESNGPDVKIRGTALHIAEKYVQLARDAQSSGDRIASESYSQHAEHYFRIVAAAQAQAPQAQQATANIRNDGDDNSDDEDDDRNAGDGDRSTQSPQNTQAQQPAFGVADPQPYVNGNGQSEAPAKANGGDEGAEIAETREPASPRPRRRRPYRARVSAENGSGEQAESTGNDAPPPPAKVEAVASAELNEE